MESNQSQREPFEERAYRSRYEMHADKIRSLAEDIQAQAGYILRDLERGRVPVLRSLLEDAQGISTRAAVMEALREMKEVYDSAAGEQADVRAETREQVAAEIERVVGGYPDNGLARPKVERGQFVNDAEWAAQIARGQWEG